MAAATLSVGVLLAILEAAPEIRVPFRVDSHHSSKLGGKSQGGRRDRNQPYRESPQRECITLDRTPGAYVPIPVADTLKAALDAAPRHCPLMLTNGEDAPWTASGFQSAWGRIAVRAGIRGLTFHDLRGTAVVTLARAGCNEVEIYAITGHKPGDVRAILTAHYLPRDAEVAGNAIAKLNTYRAAQADQKEDETLPTALPTGSKIVNLKSEKA
jgi:hypothetical protein